MRLYRTLMIGYFALIVLFLWFIQGTWRDWLSIIGLSLVMWGVAEFGERNRKR